MYRDDPFLTLEIQELWAANIVIGFTQVWEEKPSVSCCQSTDGSYWRGERILTG